MTAEQSKDRPSSTAGGTLRVRELLRSPGPREHVVVEGWLRSVRASKGQAFLALNDGSCMASLQAVVAADLPDYEMARRAGTGAAVRVEGALVASPGKGQAWEVAATGVEIIGEADDKYPLQKKRHSFEYLRSIAHLRPRANTYGAVFRVRNALSYAVHRFFQERNFVWVHTPIITGSDCEGAGEMFQVTTLDLEGLARRKEAGPVDYGQDFFDRRTGLTVSGQLEAEMFALALRDVYTFGPTFRADNSNTSRHVAEFWMIEPEIAFADLRDDLALAEAFLRAVTTEVMERCEEDLAFFGKWIEKKVPSRLASLTGDPYEVLPYEEAVRLLQKAKISFEYPVTGFGMDLQAEHERYLTEDLFQKPVFLINYPKSIKPFYMRVNDDDRTVAAVDLLVPGIGEIIGGSQREERLDVLEARIAELEMSPEELWWYIDSRRWGTAPHAGFGLGFERLVMYVTGMANIRDVLPFPRTPGHADF